MADVEERVIDIVAEQLGVDKEKVKPETSFVTTSVLIHWIQSNW